MIPPPASTQTGSQTGFDAIAVITVEQGLVAVAFTNGQARIRELQLFASCRIRHTNRIVHIRTVAGTITRHKLIGSVAFALSFTGIREGDDVTIWSDHTNRIIDRWAPTRFDTRNKLILAIALALGKAGIVEGYEITRGVNHTDRIVDQGANTIVFTWNEVLLSISVTFGFAGIAKGIATKGCHDTNRIPHIRTDTVDRALRPLIRRIAGAFGFTRIDEIQNTAIRDDNTNWVVDVLRTVTIGVTVNERIRTVALTTGEARIVKLNDVTVRSDNTDRIVDLRTIAVVAGSILIGTKAGTFGQAGITEGDNTGCRKYTNRIPDVRGKHSRRTERTDQDRSPHSRQNTGYQTRSKYHPGAHHTDRIIDLRTRAPVAGRILIRAVAGAFRLAGIREGQHTGGREHTDRVPNIRTVTAITIDKLVGTVTLTFRHTGVAKGQDISVRADDTNRIVDQRTITAITSIVLIGRVAFAFGETEIGESQNIPVGSSYTDRVPVFWTATTSVTGVINIRTITGTFRQAWLAEFQDLTAWGRYTYWIVDIQRAVAVVLTPYGDHQRYGVGAIF